MNSNLLTIKWFYNSDTRQGYLKLDDIKPGKITFQDSEPVEVTLKLI